MKIIFSTLCLLYATQAFTDDRIKDPFGILNESDQFVGSSTFADAYRCGDIATRRRQQCRLRCDFEGVCEPVCGSVSFIRQSVVNCSTDQVTIRTETTDLEPRDEVLTRVTFEAHAANPLRLTLRDLLEIQGDPKFDYVELEYSSRRDYELWDGTVAPGMKVILTWYRFDQSHQEYILFPLGITFVRGQPSLAQIIEFDESPRMFTAPTETLISFLRQ